MNMVILICTFVWIGFVGAISFMESWLKFRAPGITLPLGLGIGKIVFKALNRMEWFFAGLIFLMMAFTKNSFIIKSNVFFLITVLLLIGQTLWLLPALTKRAQVFISGIKATKSNLHYWFIGFESLKIICLFIFGMASIHSLS